jgi:hypothetical protein
MRLHEGPIRAFCVSAFAKEAIMTITAIPEVRNRLATNLLGEFAVAKVFLRAIEKG